MRYLPASEEDIRMMLSAVGAGRVEDLFASIPDNLQLKTPLDIPAGVSEPELWERFIARADKNDSLTSRPAFLGAGAYNHNVPSAVGHIIGRAEFYTAYTPYQPEISQGTLQATFEFQTMMADLTGMDACNASLYDGASAAAEAALMAHRIHKGARVLVARSLHPAYREVVRTYLQGSAIEIVEIPAGPDGRIDAGVLTAAVTSDVCAVLVGQPNFFGVVEDLAAVAGTLPEGAKKPLLVTIVAEALSLALLEPPAVFGADIVAGDAGSFGLPLGYGGPNLGFITTKKAYVRQLPGRIVGQTTDRDGKRGFVLTLSTREQHIRREKATSNICSNQGLCVVAAVAYLALMGRKGLKKLALMNLSAAEYLKEVLGKKGIYPLFSGPTFNEFAVRLPVPGSKADEAVSSGGMVGGYDLGRDYPELSGGYLLCTTECVTAKACNRLAELLGRLS